jgi:hypothetical protein
MKKSTSDTLWIIVGIGIGGAYLLKTTIPPIYEGLKSTIRDIPVVGGFLGGPGKTPAQGEVTFSIQITNPISGSTWSMLVPNAIKATITNPANIAYDAYIGLSFTMPNGTIKDIPAQRMTFNTLEIKQISWPVNKYNLLQLGIIPLITPDLGYPPGAYSMRMSAWRIPPTPQTATEADRIGDTGWIPFNFAVI